MNKSNWAFCSIVYLLCVSVIAQDNDNIPSSLLTNANAIVLSDYTKVDHLQSKKYVVQYKRAIKVLNKKGLKHGQVALYYKESSDKLSNISIKIFDKDNKLIKNVKEKELEDYSSGDGYSIVTDYRLKHFDYTPLSYPFTIEYSYKIESRNTLSLPFWRPISNYNIAVLKSEYDLNSPLKIRTKLKNFENFQTIVQKGNYFVMTHQNALTKERYAPSTKDIFPIGIFNPAIFNYENHPGQFNTWKGYGSWIYNQFLKDQKIENIAEVKKDLAQLISPSDNDYTISKKIYEFVQSNTRYISISLEEGGLNPMSPNKVHQVKYGDCKALSLYTKELLSLYDIESNYVEICAGVEYTDDLFEDYPSAYPGNHIIVNIPLENDTIWIDCTSNDNPFNYLGRFTDDRVALEITADGGKLIKTPEYNETINLAIDTVEIRIQENQNAISTLKSIYQGIKIGSDYSINNSSHKEKEEYINNRLSDNLKIKKIEKLNLNINQNEPITQWDYNMSLANFSESAGDYLFIPHEITSLDIPILPKDKKRKNPIVFNRSMSASQNITIELPYDGEIVEDLSFDTTSTYGVYKITVQKSGSKAVQINKSFTLFKGHYDEKEYKKIKSFFDLCLKTERKPITFIKS